MKLINYDTKDLTRCLGWFEWKKKKNNFCSSLISVSFRILNQASQRTENRNDNIYDRIERDLMALNISLFFTTIACRAYRESAAIWWLNYENMRFKRQPNNRPCGDFLSDTACASSSGFFYTGVDNKSDTKSELLKDDVILSSLERRLYGFTRRWEHTQPRDKVIESGLSPQLNVSSQLNYEWNKKND